MFNFNSIELERARTDPTYCLLVINPVVRATLEGLYEEYKAPVRYRCVHCETICPLIILFVIYLGEKRKNQDQTLTARNAVRYC